MPMHVAAFTISGLAAVANTDVTFLADGVVNSINGHALFQQDVSLLWAYAGSATLLRSRITSPTLRQVSQQYIRPVNAALLPAANSNVAWYANKPFRLKGLEEIAVESTATGAGERTYTLIGVADVIRPAPIGDVFYIRVTSTTAAVAATWSLLALTYETQLPAGQYSVVGGEMFSTNIIAHRWIFDNQTYRPGFIATALETSRVFWPAYQARFGEWGTFRTTNLPRCEVLANAADAVFGGYLQVIRTGGL